MTKFKYTTYCEECEAPVNKCTCDKGPTFPDPLNPDDDDKEPMICPVCGNEYKV